MCYSLFIGRGAEGFYHFVLNILNHTAKRTYKATALMTYSSQGELITFRYRGLHTRPSASDKNMDTPNGVSIFLAGGRAPPVISTIIKTFSENVKNFEI